MSVFHLHCHVARVASASSRFNRTILVRVDEWEAANDEIELPPLHAVVALHDVDVMASADPRLEYVLAVRQKAGALPFRLEGRLRNRQIKPPRKYVAVDNGLATVFTVVRVLAVIPPDDAGDDTGGLPPVTVRLVADCLRHFDRSRFAQHQAVTGEGGASPVSSPSALLAMLSRVPEISPEQRALVLDTLGDAWMPFAYTALTALHFARPSSLSQLSVHELASLTAWLNRADVLALLQGSNQASKLVASDLACIVDCLPLHTCSVSTELAPCESPFTRPAAGLFRALAAMRASNSTVGRVFSDAAAAEAIPAWAVQLGAIVPLGDDGSFTTGRYDQLRVTVSATVRELATIVATRPSHVGDRLLLVTVPPGCGGPGAARLYAEQVPPMLHSIQARDIELHLDEHQHIWYVAPTPGHAAAIEAQGLACLSVQDVMACSWPRTGPLARPSVICLLYAHAFGLRTWSAVVLDRLLAMSAAGVKLAMAGDCVSWGGEGSPHPCDGGAVFRDVCAAVRRGLLPGISFERLRSADYHYAARLYKYEQPALPKEEDDLDHVARVRVSTALAPNTAGDSGLPPLVACKSWRAAGEHWLAHVGVPPTPAGWWQSVGEWLAVPDLGLVTRVSLAGVAAAASVRMPDDARPPGQDSALVGLRSRQGMVRLAALPGTGTSHLYCCDAGDAAVMRLEMHPTAVTLAGGAPVRSLARWSPYCLAKDIVVVLPADGTAALQDVRAACALASESVHFVTTSATPGDVMQAALAQQSGGCRTLLLDVLTSAFHEQQPLPVVVRPRLPDALAEANDDAVPFYAQFLGTATHLDLVTKPCVSAAADKQQWCLTSAADCQRHLRGWLTDEAEAKANVESVSVPMAAPTSMPVPVSSPLASLPPLFVPVTREYAASTSVQDIDRHAGLRLAALRAIIPLANDAPLAADAAQTALAAYAPLPDNAAIEAAAVHMLCMAVKGDAAAEAWLLAAEQALFARRVAAVNADAATLQQTFPSARHKDLAADIDDEATAATAQPNPLTPARLAGWHRARLRTYLQKYVQRPAANGNEFDSRALVYRAVLIQ